MDQEQGIPTEVGSILKETIDSEELHKQRQRLSIISAYIGSPLTEEQMDFAADFTKNTISFSDPGTGKTHTLIAGLIMAQQHHKVPGTSINCMSFTNAAVAEMAGRYEKLCKSVSVSPTVKFNTFHSLTRAILTSAYPGITVVDGYESYKSDITDLTSYMKQLGYDVSMDDTKYVRRVLRAINDMNSSMTFHPTNLSKKYDFVSLDLNLDDFQSLRTSMFVRGLVTKSINVGDIPLYCLYALMMKEDVIKMWKGKYRIMVVDEFQDLSLLHLNILSYIAQTLVVIGDMKQQIYAFNGACPQIVSEYFKMRPDARVCNLTKSFRCGKEIAEFATRVILPNDRSIQCFGGHERGSRVSLIQRRDLDWKDIVSKISADRKVNGYGGMRDVMFLYRNNASAIPVIEELYKNKIPFRCSKFAKVMDVPLFSTISLLANAAWQPNNVDICKEALKVFPEFRGLPFNQDPAPVLAMKSSGKDLLSINYKYRDPSSIDILAAIAAARKAIEENKNAGVVYMKFMPVYDKYLHKLEWWKLDREKEFYFGLVAPICNVKPYPLMYAEELDKESENRKATAAGTGIRCYTMHSAKGLEADDVYILDCDEGSFPNAKVMEKKRQANCYYDVAVDVRSERNLLYVAITRAKDSVTISYSGTNPTLLISDPDNEQYSQYDKFYQDNTGDYNDAEEFFRLFKMGEYAND